MEHENVAATCNNTDKHQNTVFKKTVKLNKILFRIQTYVAKLDKTKINTKSPVVVTFER